MSANTSPIYSATPTIQWGNTSITSANTSYTGVRSPMLVFSAGTNGSRVETLSFMAAGGNVATVGRVYINNGGTTETPTNNVLFTEINLPATSSLTTSSNPRVDVSMGLPLAQSTAVYVTLGGAVTSGYFVYAYGGHY